MVAYNMHSTFDFMMNGILETYSQLENSNSRRISWNDMSEEELWYQLCLCILSSNVMYELAYSAFQHLKSKKMLSIEYILKNPSVGQKMASVLSQRIYSPRKRNGTMRKYRFPRRRSQDIVKSAEKLYLDGNGIYNLLLSVESDSALRDQLAKELSGVGLKQASHFLRNIGYSDSLAIIDTHILKFLNEIHGLNIEENRTITSRKYHDLEKLLIEMCELMDLNLGLFDSAIWHYMRGR